MRRRGFLGVACAALLGGNFLSQNDPSVPMRVETGTREVSVGFRPDAVVLGNEAFIPEIWARESLAILEENMVVGQIIHRDFCSEGHRRLTNRVACGTI